MDIRPGMIVHWQTDPEVDEKWNVVSQCLKAGIPVILVESDGSMEVVTHL